MFNITDILSLGSAYTVADQAGNIINTIQVIPMTELLEAAVGPYTDDFGNFQTYIDRSIETLSGYDEIDPYRVLWFATSEDEVALSEIIEYAVKNGYDRIILEHLEELE